MVPERFSITGLLVYCAVCVSAARADTATLGASKDNTLYEDSGGAFSNGSGVGLFVGRTSNGAIRRGLIAFDVAADIPAGSTITGARLTMNMSRTVAGEESVELRRVLTDWGEGSSNALRGGGVGASATTGDATWLHTFFDTSRWTSPGGDFSSTISASTLVAAEGPYTWGSTSGMVADVQEWLDNPSANFGWILIGDETSVQTAKRFDTKETLSPQFRPMLTIEFTAPSTGGGGGGGGGGAGGGGGGDGSGQDGNEADGTPASCGSELCGMGTAPMLATTLLGLAGAKWRIARPRRRLR